MSKKRQKHKDTPLKVAIEGDELVVRIGIKTLSFCTEHQPGIIDDCGEYESPYVKIDDEREFANDVVHGLLSEEEDGSTVISRCIDAACLLAIEDGSVAVDYDFQPKRIKDHSP